MGRVFLLTGATGFVGKVVLEELLRRREELDVERVHVLIRPRRNQRPEDRFRREVATSPCFARLPEGWTRDVRVLPGNLDAADLGLDASTRTELAAEVTHVVHTAASVSFDLPLAEAARANVATSLTLLDLVQSWRRLERLVHVSTAYVTPHPGDGAGIEEVLAPLPAPAAELYRSIVEGRTDELALMRRSGHPNTYTLTKSIAEHLMVERRGRVPLTIVRPSIISASWAHPFPGWIDSTSGFASFVVLIGMGHLRVVAGGPDTRLDLVPVDEVATCMLEECCREEPELAGRDRPRFRHAVAGLRRTVPLAEVGERITEFYSAHPVDRTPVIKYLGPRGLRFRLAESLHHSMPMAAAELCPGGRGTGQLRARLKYLNRVFPYFTGNCFDFRSTQPPANDFDAGSYITTVCRGAYRHLLRREDPPGVVAVRRPLRQRLSSVVRGGWVLLRARTTGSSPASWAGSVSPKAERKRDEAVVPGGADLADERCP